MSVNTAGDIINHAYQNLGIGAEGETLSFETMNLGLDVLNIMLASWSARGILSTAQLTENFTLTANKGNYTIGISQDFNTAKPIEIVQAFVRDTDDDVDYPIDIVTRDVYNSYIDKALTGISSRPTNLFYDPGVSQQTVQKGTVCLYPIPDSSTTYDLYLVTEKYFNEFANLTDSFTFQTSYKRPIIYNLSVELAPKFGISISPEIKLIADESLKIIETMNSENKRQVMNTGLPGQKGVYNIYIGEYE
jgi:hypothetical protein